MENDLFKIIMMTPVTYNQKSKTGISTLQSISQIQLTTCFYKYSFIGK